MSDAPAEHDAAELMAKAFAALAAGDLDALAACWHEDVVEDFVALGTVEGKAALRQFFAEMLAAFPDLQLETVRIMGTDETTAVGEWILSGTFRGGSFRGIEPSGRAVRLRGLDIMQFDDGLLRRNTVYYDGLAFARQIGMLPREGTRADGVVQAGFNALMRLKGRLRS